MQPLKTIQLKKEPILLMEHLISRKIIWLTDYQKFPPKQVTKAKPA